MKPREIGKIVAKNSFSAISTVEPDRAYEIVSREALKYADEVIGIYPTITQEGVIGFKLEYFKKVNDGFVDKRETEVTSHPEDLLAEIKKEIENQERGSKVIITYLQTQSDGFIENEGGMALLNYIQLDVVDVDVSFSIIGKHPRIPKDYEVYFYRTNLDLPNEEELKNILDLLIGNEENNEKSLSEFIKNPYDIEKIIRYGKGLTREQFISAVRLATEVDEFGFYFINPEKIKEVKENLIKKSEVLEVYHPKEVDKLIGFEGAREFVRKLFEKKELIPLKGILLLGIPGIGKSLFAKNIAKETDVPTVIFNPARVFNAYVGESERRMEEALNLIDQIGDCIVFIDEIDKAIAGMGAGGRGDNGVSERVFGMLLSWLNDKQTNSFVIATANRIKHLPIEFLREGRWNAIYFVDYYPKVEHYQQLVEYYTEKYKLPKELIDISPEILQKRKFTGAEIKGLVEMAVIFDEPLSEAIERKTTLYESNPQAIETMRQEASYVNALDVYTNKPTKFGNSEMQEERKSFSVRKKLKRL